MVRRGVILLLAVLLIASIPTRGQPAKRIVIHLSDKTVTAYEGGEVTLEARGIMGTGSHPVAVGDYHVTGRERRVRGHIGPDSTTTPWVLHLDNGASIHGTMWKKRMGAVMMHGNVALGNKAAEQLWAWAEVGTPVVVRE
jgi:lipoprotein-anchoring transpeptidase ErfK/SrfK